MKHGSTLGFSLQPTPTSTALNPTLGMVGIAKDWGLLDCQTPAGIKASRYRATAISI